MPANQPQVIKDDGRLQRSDIALTDKVASALVQKIFAGEPIYTRGKDVEITYIGENGEEVKETYSQNTVSSWIKRGNVVPSTGESLRDLLDRARAEYRTKVREEKQQSLIDKAEAKMGRALNLRTTVPIRNMFGQIVYNEDGSVARRENHNVLRIQMDASKFVLERLDPARYGKVERGEHKHLVFSLADLRKEKRNLEQNETVSSTNVQNE